MKVHLNFFNFKEMEGKDGRSGNRGAFLESR